MGTKIQKIEDYIGYIKCGEILKSPLQNYQEPFVLKCFHCAEIHFLLESFIIHIQEHCNDEVSSGEGNETKTSNLYSNQEHVDSEGAGIENLTIKLEADNAMEMEDPLIVVKNEIDTESSNIKEEYSLHETKIANKNFAIENYDKFDEDLVDSTDEFQLDDTESDEDEEINKSARKRVKKLSPLVDTFMKSQSNVTTLIELYKNQPNLWNKDSSHYRLKDKRQQFLLELSQDLNNKLNLKLTWEEVAEIIAHICGKHRDDFRRLQNHKEKDKNGKTYKRCWYFKDLHFLRHKEVIQLETLDSQLPDLLPEQIIKILAIYQGFSHLWNTNLIEYICSNKRHEAIIEMLQMLETNMNLKITKYALEEYIRTIHNYFSKEKRLRSNYNTKQASKTADISCSTSEYYEHMTFLNDHEGPFACIECNRLYSKPLSFRVHKSQHDGSIPLVCSQCNKEFKTVSSYTTHAKRHLEDLGFVCMECGKKFLNNNDLKIHMLMHTGAKPYCCEICGAAYRHVQCFKKHQRRHEKRFSHTCHICSKGYYSKDRYNDHMNSHMNIRAHVCKLCGKGFITSRALKTHSVTHEDVRNHACNLCGKTFKLKIGVLQHMRSHGSKVESDERNSGNNFN